MSKSRGGGFSNAVGVATGVAARGDPVTEGYGLTTRNTGWAGDEGTDIMEGIFIVVEVELGGQ